MATPRSTKKEFAVGRVEAPARRARAPNKRDLQRAIQFQADKPLPAFVTKLVKARIADIEKGARC